MDRSIFSVVMTIMSYTDASKCIDLDFVVAKKKNHNYNRNL